MKILLIEDDKTLVDILVNTLAAEHYAVDVAADGQSGWEMASAFGYDLILLDVMLPKLDGISLCRKLRSHGSPTAILLLTAEDNSNSKVMGLDAGADDYMTKPFDPAELLARIRALQRRETATRRPILTWEGLALDPSTREVSYQREPVSLRPREYDLLELFLRHPQRVFSRGSILDHLWSFEDSPGEETITAHIKGLRHHLKAAGVAHDPIETVYGIGYRLRGAEPEAPATTANTVTAAIWERAKARLRDRIAVIERATSAACADTLADELRQRAETEAHKLAGSLGMFNFDQGSKLAQQAEQAFHDWPQLPPQQRTRMIELAETLSQSVQQAIRSDTPTLFDSSLSAGRFPANLPAVQAAPALWVVSPDSAFCEALQTVDSATPWTIQVHSNAISAYAELGQQRPHLVVLDCPAPAPLTPEIATFLTELQALTPSVPVLIRTDPTTLLDRVALARLGGQGFISSAMPPVTVLETATDVWMRSRPNNATVLVVDDDPQVLETLRYLLEPWGLIVFTLDDPRQFWTVFNDDQPDLLVLDVEMPYVDGLALCQVVRSDLQQHHIPILFLTAHTDAATQHRVFEVGADDYVTKPIVGPTVITRILNRLERSRRRQPFRQTDALTGLTNRQACRTAVAQYLAQEADLCLAAIRVDPIDRVNRQCGDDEGDAVLIALAQRLRQMFADPPESAQSSPPSLSHPLVARWSGCRFVVALPHLPPAQGLPQLRDKCAELSLLPLSQRCSEQGIGISVSAALVTSAAQPEPSASPSLIDRALARLDQGQPGQILSA